MRPILMSTPSQDRSSVSKIIPAWPVHPPVPPPARPPSTIPMDHSYHGTRPLSGLSSIWPTCTNPKGSWPTSTPIAVGVPMRPPPLAPGTARSRRRPTRSSRGRDRIRGPPGPSPPGPCGPVNPRFPYRHHARERRPSHSRSRRRSPSRSPCLRSDRTIFEPVPSSRTGIR
jgi:hypothetical protein